MPIYEYQCEHCGQQTEAIQRLDEPPLESCPHCGGALRKLMSAPAFQFKGSGWYVTDYADKGRKDGKSPKPNKAASEAGSETSDSPVKDTGKDSSKTSASDSADSS